MSALRKLYINAICPFAQRARIAAIEKNIAVEEVNVPLTDPMPEWYAKINPRETVPALQIEGGAVVFESMIVARYFDELGAPRNSLNPGDAATRHQTAAFIEGPVGEAIGEMYSLLMGPVDSRAEGIASATKALDALEAAVASAHPTGPFFHGATFSLADLSIVPFLDRFQATLKAYHGFEVFANRPRLRALLREALLRPSVANTRLPARAYIEGYRSYGKVAPTLPDVTLYTARVCPFAQRARFARALLLKNDETSVKLEYLDLEALPDWYVKLNPLETVPALVIRDGNEKPRVLGESLLIAEYLDNEFGVEGSTKLTPADPKLAADSRFAIDECGNAFGALWGLKAGDDASKKNFAAAWGRFEALFAKQSPSGPFFLGSTPTFADVAVAPQVLRAQAIAKSFAGVDFETSFPRLAGLTKAVRQHEALAPYTEPEEEYLAALKRLFAL